jgi:sugar phosphate isomerase/epimerase
MVREMVDLGFEYIELSHGVRITLVPGILRAIEEGIVKVSSTHNFCPLPTGVNQAAPNLFEPSDPDPREIGLWLRHTKRSIDFAVQVNSTALVCHLGSVQFLWRNPGRTLANYIKRHPKADIPHGRRYQGLLEKAQARLRKRMEPYWERTKESVGKVLKYAAERGVRLGLENREKLEELPVDEDLVDYFGMLPLESAAGYWHDTGHAHIKESMGLINHRAQLENMAARTIGFHLHDVGPDGQDHQSLGSGKVDFNMISEFWRPEHFLVIELSPRVPVEGVRASLARLQKLVKQSGSRPPM